MKRILLAAIATVMCAGSQVGAALFVEDFESQTVADVNSSSQNPFWRSSHRNIVVEANAAGNRLRTSWDTGTQIIGAQFSDTPLDITTGGLHIALDYYLERRDTSRILFGLQAGRAWDSVLNPITAHSSGQGIVTNFVPGNANPDTHYTADWSGYQAVVRLDGSVQTGSSATHIARNGGPLTVAGITTGSVWYQNNTVLDTGASVLPDLAVWRSAQLSIFLNQDGHVVVELYEGADRQSLQLLATSIDDDPAAILSGLQHIAIGVTNSGNAAVGASGNPIVRFDNITVVPEPASVAIAGLAGLLVLRRRPRAN